MAAKRFPAGMCVSLTERYRPFVCITHGPAYLLDRAAAPVLGHRQVDFPAARVIKAMHTVCASNESLY